MATSFDALVARLKKDVPARSDVPDHGQYEQAIRDAVADYNGRAPMQRNMTLSIVTGTAVYSLPADFIRVIKLENLANPEGVIVSGAGLIPVPPSFRERYMVTGLTITFYPTPVYTLARNLWYAAGHVLDADDVYAEMTPDVEALIALKAQALALSLQANKAAQEAWSYQIGDERVSKEKLAAELRAQSQAAEQKYMAATAGRIGQVGMRASYEAGEYS